MRNRFRLSTGVVAAAVMAIFSLASQQTAGQAPGYKAPRAVGGRADLNGIWQAVGTANWDLPDHAAGVVRFWRVANERLEDNHIRR